MFSSLFHSKSLAIDLGNNNTLLSNSEEILLSEPSCIVYDVNTNKVKAVGGPAFEILGKNTDDLKAVQPLKWGVIADHQSANAMIGSMVSKTMGRNSIFNRYSDIISGVPYSATSVEQRALRDVLSQFNSKRCSLIYEPIAAALGMGLDIREPDGKMILDIGGGITEIAVISLSGVVVFRAVKVAGNSFTESIIDHLRWKHNIQVGWKSAEMVKHLLGSLSPEEAREMKPVSIKGKDLRSGLPIECRVDALEICDLLIASFRHVEDQVIQVLESSPPELSADIYKNGIHVTGGGALLPGLRQRLEQSIQVPVHIDPHPLLSVSKGISRVLSDSKKHAAILL